MTDRLLYEVSPGIKPVSHLGHLTSTTLPVNKFLPVIARPGKESVTDESPGKDTFPEVKVGTKMTAASFQEVIQVQVSAKSSKTNLRTARLM